MGSFVVLVKFMVFKKKLSEAKLENKIWFRFLKVSYIGLSLLLYISSLFLIYITYKPYKIKNFSKIIINCQNGETYNIKDILDSDFEIRSNKDLLESINKAEELQVPKDEINQKLESELLFIDNFSWNEFIHSLQSSRKYSFIYGFSEKDEIKIKRLCKFGLNKEYFNLDQYNSSEYKNYELKYEVTKVGNWGNIITYELLAIFVIYLFLEAIKRIFFYIILGKNPLN
jgi:hypothetical protein